MSGAPNPIAIEFAARGVDAVLNDLKSIEERMAGVERKSRAAAKAMALLEKRPSTARANDAAKASAAADQATVKSAKHAADARVSANADANRRIEAATKASTARMAANAARESARLQRSIARAESRTRLELVRNPKLAASIETHSPQNRLEILAAAKGRSPEAMRAALDTVRDLRAESKVHEEIEKKKTRTEEVEGGKRRALRDRIARDNGKFASKQAAEDRRARERKAERFYESMVGGGARAVNTMGRFGATVARGAVTQALDLGGGFSIQGALQEEKNLDRDARLLSVAARTPDNPTPIDPKHIKDTVRAESVRTGVDAGELMSGLNSYVARSADYKGGEKNLGFFAKVAKSTGGNIEDVMKMAGSLKVQAGDRLDDAGMRNLILASVMQSRQGSVEAQDVARAGGKVTRTSGAYTGSQAERMKDLMGLAQIGMRVGGSVEESATMISNLSGDAMKHHGDVEALLGKKFLNDKGQIQIDEKTGVAGFVADLLTASGGNLQKLQDAHFGQRSMKLFQASAPVFNAAEAEALKAGKSKAEAKEAGRQAVLKDINTVTSAKYDEKDLEKDYAEVMASASEQFDQAVRELRAVVGQELLPVMKSMIGPMKEAAPHVREFLRGLNRLVQWMDRNPLATAFAVLGAGIAGVGASITLEVAKSIATAKVGEFIKSLLAGGGGGGGVPGGGSVPGKLGKGLAVVGAGLLAGELTKEAVDEHFSDENKRDDGRRSRLREAKDLAVLAGRGELTPEQKKRAIELSQQLNTDKRQIADEMDPEKQSIGNKVLGTFANVVDSKGAAEAALATQQAQTTALKEATEAQSELAKALTSHKESLDANTKATEANTKAPTGAPGTRSNAPGPYSPTGPMTARDRSVTP